MTVEDKLKRYVQNHKADFDMHKAPSDTWDKIEQVLVKEKSTGGNRKYIVGVVLTVLIALGVYYALYRYANKEIDDYPKIQANDEVLEFAELEDFEETRRYYITKASESLEELTTMHTDIQLEQDLQLLDAAEQELRNELKEAEGIYQEQILRAIIQNQQIKLDLINSVLHQIILERDIQKSKNYETI